MNGNRRQRSGTSKSPPSTQIPIPAPPGHLRIDWDTPPAGSTYPSLLRRPGEGWTGVIRPVAGLLIVLSAYVLITSVVVQTVIAASWAVSSPQLAYGTYYAEASALERPIGMIASNLGLACLIPISFAGVAIVHRVRPGWLGSVRPRLRWGYLGVCLAVAAVAMAGVFVLSTLAGPELALDPQPQFVAFMIIIVLTSPLQAIGEEYLFRGYLMQAFGSMVATPWFGIVVSSVVFALFHGTQNLPLFLDRLAFGLLAAILVYKTGGLEAGIAAHVINNVYAWGLAAVTSSVAEVRAMQEVGWVDAAFDVAGFAVFAALAWLVAHRLKVQTRSGPPAS